MLCPVDHAFLACHPYRFLDFFPFLIVIALQLNIRARFLHLFRIFMSTVQSPYNITLLCPVIQYVLEPPPSGPG